MVLSDLGRRLTTAFRDLQGTAPIDEKVISRPRSLLTAAI